MKNMGADNETGAGDHPLAGMTLERGNPTAGPIVSRLIAWVTSGVLAAVTVLPSILGFAAPLGASGYSYAAAPWTQSLPDWIGAHGRAFA